MRGMIHLGTHPVPIIMVHGYFSSNKIGPHRLYFQIAQGLNKLGYTVLRTDLSGMGESDGIIEDISFSDHVLDTEAIIRYVMQRKDICPSGRIHLLGHCIGCCTALKACQHFKQNVESVTLLSPFIPSRENHIKMLGKVEYHKIVTTGSGYRKDVFCCNSFLSAAYILTNPLILDMLRCIRVRIVFSEYDEFSSITDSVNWVNSIPSTHQIIRGANHNYIGPVVRKELIEYLSHIFSSG